jgi:hypothetical protein
MYRALPFVPCHRVTVWQRQSSALCEMRGGASRFRIGQAIVIRLCSPLHEGRGTQCIVGRRLRGWAAGRWPNLEFGKIDVASPRDTKPI